MSDVVQRLRSMGTALAKSAANRLDAAEREVERLSGECDRLQADVDRLTREYSGVSLALIAVEQERNALRERVEAMEGRE